MTASELLLIGVGGLVALGVAWAAASYVIGRPASRVQLVVTATGAMLVAVLSVLVLGAGAGAVSFITTIGVVTVAAGVLAYLGRHWHDPSSGQRNRSLLLLLALAAAAILLRVVGALSR